MDFHVLDLMLITLEDVRAQNWKRRWVAIAASLLCLIRPTFSGNHFLLVLLCLCIFVFLYFVFLFILYFWILVFLYFILGCQAACLPCLIRPTFSGNTDPLSSDWKDRPILRNQFRRRNRDEKRHIYRETIPIFRTKIIRNFLLHDFGAVYDEDDNWN